MPKSPTLHLPSLVRKMFAGLRSLWTIPFAETYSRTHARASTTLRASDGSSPSGNMSRTVRKVGPSTYSITNQIGALAPLHVHQSHDSGMFEAYESRHLPFKTSK